MESSYVTVQQKHPLKLKGESIKTSYIMGITHSYSLMLCTITSKINVTPRGVYLFISKLHSILAIANLLAHNNISQICYCSQISLQCAVVYCSFSDTFKSTFYFAGDSTLRCLVKLSLFLEHHRGSLNWGCGSFKYSKLLEGWLYN